MRKTKKQHATRRSPSYRTNSPIPTSPRSAVLSTRYSSPPTPVPNSSAPSPCWKTNATPIHPASTATSLFRTVLNKHRTERGSAGSNTTNTPETEFDPALPRSVLCLFNTVHTVHQLNNPQIAPLLETEILKKTYE